MSYIIEKSFASGYVGKNLTGKNFVIAHESGNPNNVGKDALENELSYMKRNIKNANVSHWVGGGGRIVQILPTGKVQWGVGPKGNPYSYAQVELARTNDKEQFKKDYAAYIWLLKQLANESSIPQTLDTGFKVADKGIKTHAWVSNNLGGTNHTDPYGYLASMGISKAQFKKDIEQGSVSAPSAPVAEAKPAQTVSNAESIVDYLNKNGIDSSYSNRSKLAKQYGISNYSGTAAQNIRLLSKVKSGAPVASTGNSFKAYSGSSIVDFLNLNKIDSSFNNRKKLASQYGLANYTGAASQNTALLNAMQKSGATTTKPKSNYAGSSLVDYLKSINVDSSFANRKKLAAQYGVKNYSGTAVQNSQLLNKMR